MIGHILGDNPSQDYILADQFDQKWYFSPVSAKQSMNGWESAIFYEEKKIIFLPKMEMGTKRGRRA